MQLTMLNKSLYSFRIILLSVCVFFMGDWFDWYIFLYVCTAKNAHAFAHFDVVCRPIFATKSWWSQPPAGE